MKRVICQTSESYNGVVRYKGYSILIDKGMYYVGNRHGQPIYECDSLEECRDYIDSLVMFFESGE